MLGDTERSRSEREFHAAAPASQGGDRSWSWAAVREDGILVRKSPALEVFSPAFLNWVNNSQRISESTRKYYRQGWNLSASTKLKQNRMDQIRDEHVEVTTSSVGLSNADCAIRTLRRMLGKVKDDGLVARCPKLQLRNEAQRLLLMDDASEAKILPLLSENAADVIVIMRRQWNAKPQRSLTHEVGIRQLELVLLHQPQRQNRSRGKAGNSFE